MIKNLPSTRVLALETAVQAACAAGVSIKPGAQAPGQRYRGAQARDASDSLKNICRTPTPIFLYHIVFSTKDRRPLITPEYEARLHDYIGGTIRSIGGICLELNGTEDHIHLLAKLRPTRAVSDVLRDLKANASGWMHDVFPSLGNFSWQRGYGAFTVSHSNVESVRRYIARQKEHHQGLSFRDEFIQFLKANGVEYDERFL